MLPATLKELLLQLQSAETVPRPESEQWDALITRISVPGTIAGIGEETYSYFLEVLPPRFQRGSLFAFLCGRPHKKAYVAQSVMWC